MTVAYSRGIYNHVAPTTRSEARLLGEVEAGALDPSVDLAKVLRKCISLGCAT